MRRRFALTVTVLAAAIFLIYAPTFAQAPDPPAPVPSADAQLAVSVAALTDALTWRADRAGRSRRRDGRPGDR